MARCDFDIGVIGGGVKLSTLTEIIKRVAGSFLSTTIFSAKVKRGLKLFFQLKEPIQDSCSKIK
jgi:hypothetical protein